MAIWMAEYVPLRKAVERLGLHSNTLRKHADDGRIQSIRTPHGQRLFDVEPYLSLRQKTAIICYCRVSSSKQRDDLQRQVERMRESFPQAEVVSDIGSGLNFKGKGLQSLLGRILQGEKLAIVVSHRDRLARFGFELIQFISHANGGKIVVLDESLDTQPETELTADLLSILHHFSCKMRGRRSAANRYQSEKNTNLPDNGTEKSV